MTQRTAFGYFKTSPEIVRLAVDGTAGTKFGSAVALGGNIAVIGAPAHAEGRGAAWSGSDCTPWYGDIVDRDMAVSGNMLIGEATLTAMADTFRNTEDCDLAERLLLALKAGNAAGGDKRGKQSAALKVYHWEAYPWLDLRVDDHAEPVGELWRIYTIARQQLLPFVAELPTRAGPRTKLPTSVSDMLLRPPPDRPGGGGSAP
jgi:hypothetical protein